MKILRWLALQLFRVLGWKLMGNIPHGIRKAVLVVAPHTSNWDGFYGLLFCFVKQLPIRFAIKKEVLFFPIGPGLKWIGAIPIDRKKKSASTNGGSMVQLMTAMLQQQDTLMLIIAPEGTRSRVKRWKQGFYHIALQAKVPLVLSYIDYKQKHIGFGPTVYPTGDIAKDLPQIQAFYKDKVGKYPEQGTN
jgi:1-acyl-sn-glycerol-3-phosphate acyltransferase